MPLTDFDDGVDAIHWQVIVAGGGNAGLCAAIEAAERGKRVLLLESAPSEYRGGNSRHTRNFRCMHKAPLSRLTDTYLEDEYIQDLIAVTKGNIDPHLALMTIQQSEQCLPWMEAHGVRFQPALTGTLSLSRTNAFFLGGGKALVNAYYRVLDKLGVRVVYNATVQHLHMSKNGQHVQSIDVDVIADRITLQSDSFVLACGGFQADLEWLARAWGPAARNFLVRGTAYNRGVVLKDLLDQGATPAGDPTQCHAVAIDGRAPQFDGGIATRLDCVPFSIVVNRDGNRFYDEGEDVWPKRYAIWGRLVAAQPDQIAYSIIDDRAIDLFMPSVYPPVSATTIDELATLLNLPVKQTVDTVASYNQACRDGEFHSTTLDGLSTQGIEPIKSNWARQLINPPFHAYILKPGVTFTYLGLQVNETAKVQHTQGEFSNVWAAGEIMAGSILGQGYLAGFGMTIGTVFGRIAGQEAAKHAS